MKYDVTKAEIKAFTKMLEGVKQAYIVDEDATAIIVEDANDYFIGRKSLDEVVKLIENRLTTMVNE